MISSVRTTPKNSAAAVLNGALGWGIIGFSMKLMILKTL